MTNQFITIAVGVSDAIITTTARPIRDGSALRIVNLEIGKVQIMFGGSDEARIEHELAEVLAAVQTLHDASILRLGLEIQDALAPETDG